MAKKDDITLIIAKALSEQDLTAKEKDLCCDLTISNLVSEHGLNDIQSRHVLNWCAIQQSKLSSQMKKEVLEEGLFSFFKNKKNNLSRIVKQNIEVSQNINDSQLGSFLRALSKFTSRLEKEGLHREKVAREVEPSGMDSLLDIATETNIDQYSDHMTVSPAYMKELNKTLVKIKHVIRVCLHLMETTYNSRSAKNERRDHRSTQHRELLKIISSSRHMSLQHKKNYLREVMRLVEAISLAEDMRSKREKMLITKEVADYAKDLYNRLTRVYKNEQDITTRDTTRM